MPIRVAPGGGLAVLVLFSLSACATARSTGRPSAIQCRGDPLPVGWGAPGKVLLFGEVHGTRELPAAFGEIACQAARSGPVLVGLEIPRSEEQRLAALLQARGAEERETLLRYSPFWTRDDQDGRTSQAMAALIGRLAELRAAGLPLEVFGFDVEDGAASTARDERMAVRIAAAARTHAGSLVAILIGNLHARTAQGAPWDPSFRSTGTFLKDAGLDVLGLDHAGEGTAWLCMRADGGSMRQTCGPASWANRTTAPPGVTALGSSAEGGYAGTWRVPTLTASPPAVAPAAP